MSAVEPVLFLAAAWGYVASWANEVIKQDGWPKWVNTLIANAVVVVTAAVVVLEKAPTFTLAAFGHALLGAFAAAVINHTLFLSPTGIAGFIKTRTSVVKSPEPDPVVSSVPVAPVVTSGWTTANPGNYQVYGNTVFSGTIADSGSPSAASAVIPSEHPEDQPGSLGDNHYAPTDDEQPSEPVARKVPAKKTAKKVSAKKASGVKKAPKKTS